MTAFSFHDKQYPKYAANSYDQPCRVIEKDGDGVCNYRRAIYLIEFKSWRNFGIYRANGVGPTNEVNKNKLRILFNLLTRKKAPQNFDDLMSAYAENGFTVTRIENGNYKNIVI